MKGSTYTFKGWHLVIAVLTILSATALIPVGVQAAGTLVSITDSTGVGDARVLGGKLMVGDGSGPLTVDDGSGPMTVDDGSGPMTVDGSVRPGVYPGSTSARAISQVNTATPQAQLYSLLAPTTRLAVSSLTLSNTGTATAFISIDAYQPPAASSCLTAGGTGKGVLAIHKLAPGENFQLTFPYPYVAPQILPTANWCLRGTLSAPVAGTNVLVGTVGFLTA